MHRNTTHITDTEFDVVIVGGGIYGAWLAYITSLNGLKTCLMEQNDWASGTSSASSKLIHGGLRYLENRDFFLVYKTLHEREWLLKHAPHRVQALKFISPVYNDSRYTMLTLKMGLYLYDLLSGFKHISPRHQIYTNEQIANGFDYLEKNTLKGICSYYDAVTDDARLTLELISGALEHHCAALNYMKVIRFNDKNSKVESLITKDRLTGEMFTINTKAVVLTTGPWQLDSIQSDNSYKLNTRLIKGVHLILPEIPQIKSSKEANAAFLLTTKSDKRVFFLIPWNGRSLLGTTESEYWGDLNQIPLLDHEIDYLLNEINHRFKGLNWNRGDIQGGFTGVRTLLDQKNKDDNSTTRDWSCSRPYDNVFASIGGKLTSARCEATSLKNALLDYLNYSKDNKEKDLNTPWCPGIDYMQWQSEVKTTGERLGIRMDIIKSMMSRYGKHINVLFKLIEDDPSLKQPLVDDLAFCIAELHYIVKHEMVVHLDDILRRRMPLLILNKFNETSFHSIAKLCGDLMGWSEQQLTDEIERAKSNVYTEHWS